MRECVEYVHKKSWMIDDDGEEANFLQSQKSKNLGMYNILFILTTNN